MKTKKNVAAVIGMIAGAIYTMLVVAVIKRRKKESSKMFTYAETKKRCNWSYLIGLVCGAFYYWYADKEIKESRKMFGLKNKDERFISRLERLNYGCKIDEWSEFGRWIEANTEWKSDPEDGMKAGVCSGMIIFYNPKEGYYTV